MLWLLALFFVAQVRAACDPSVELCRVDSNSGDLHPAGTSSPSPNAPSHPNVDACGVPNGNGQSCLGCDGVLYPNGGKPELDACNVCGGDGTSCCGLGECSQHGTCIDAQCRCRPGWAGALCELEAVLCEGVECGVHGTCEPSTGQCTCDEDWMGSRCQMRNCLPYGAYDSETDSCVCGPYWGGAECTECAAPHKHAHQYVCRGPGNIDAVRDREAYVLLKHKRAWLPNTEHDGVAYDCACRPHVAEVEERLVNAQELEDALNAVNFLQVNRFTDDVESLEAKVEAANDKQDDRIRNAKNGHLFAWGVYVLTTGGVAAVSAFVINRNAIF